MFLWQSASLPGSESWAGGHAIVSSAEESGFGDSTRLSAHGPPESWEGHAPHSC